MGSVLVRNLPEATHRALKLRAVKHGRSTEAELRQIIEAAVRPPKRLKLGTELAKIGKEIGMSEEEWAMFQENIKRDKTPVEPMRLD